jgi:predicted transcriptional regulator
MTQQTSSVDDLLSRLGLANKPLGGYAAGSPERVVPVRTTQAAKTGTSPAAEPAPGIDPDAFITGTLRRDTELRLAETLQRLKGGGAASRLADPVVISGPTAPNTPAPRIESPKTGVQPSVSPLAEQFWPRAPRQLLDLGISDSDIVSLILKFLSHRGTDSGSHVAIHVGLRYPVIEPMMRQLKADKLVMYKSSLPGGDYQYELTDLGRERARHLSEMCTYYGTAPVPLGQYVDSVKAQSITGLKPSLTAIRQALGDLNINEQLLSNVGQAIHSGRGMFLFGAAGNGKTSIAERVTKSFGDTIWIPKCISAAGEIIRLFDPNRHKPVPVTDPDILDEFDGRWVHIERPTIVVGGELRMENLDNTGIGEAPLQLKANCGTLLIDDFGRQTMPVDELLNRWIIPLEQRHDFLQLESGRSIQVPFDELIIFSTNLEPKHLVDDAFLRRIPYKIEIKDPSEEEFRGLLLSLASQLGFQCHRGAVDYLIRTHYTPIKRPFRFCQPRDLLRQVENRCTLHGLPRVVDEAALDQAVNNYFSIM